MVIEHRDQHVAGRVEERTRDHATGAIDDRLTDAGFSIRSRQIIPTWFGTLTLWCATPHNSLTRSS